MSLIPNSLSAALDMYELCVFLKGLLREARSAARQNSVVHVLPVFRARVVHPSYSQRVHKKLVHSMIPPNPNATKDDTTLIMVCIRPLPSPFLAE